MSYYGRIEVLERNLSGSVILDVKSTGATVIPASRGPEEPVFIGRNQSNFITQLFGNPSADYPGVWEAIEYNKSRPIWLSAPNINGTLGGVFVTRTGTIPFTNGLTTAEIADFSTIAVTERVAVGDGLTTNFIFTLDKFTYYNNMSIDILVNSVSIAVTATDVPVEILTTLPDVGDGTYTRATGVLNFLFDTAPLLGDTIDVVYTMDLSTACYFCLTDRDFQVDNRAVKISMDTNKVFTLNLYELANNKYSALASSGTKISLTENYRDSTGNNIDIREVLRDDLFFNYILNPTLAVTTFVNDTTYVDLFGGDRGDVVDAVDLARGWEYFKNRNNYSADIFFDTTADNSIPALFDSLRTNNQEYRAFILPLPKTVYGTAITNKQALSISNRGLYFYWNWGLVKDTISGTSFWSTLTGRIALRCAFMDDVFNGLAPSWVNENNHGGQIGGGILKLAYDIPDESVAIELDAAGINPIIQDPVYGNMIISQKTSLTEESDYSYIGHSRLDDWIIDNIVRQALPYQITKLNDEEHRAIVRSKIEAIISAPAGKPYNLIREFLVKCDSENNNDVVLSRKEFIVEVYIKHTPFSERIKLIFSAVGATVNIEETYG